MGKGNYRCLTCRLCGERNLKPVLHLEPIPLPDAYVPASKVDKFQPVFPLDLVLCQNCGHTQLQEVVDPGIIYKDYIYETVSSLGLVSHFTKYAHEVLSSINPPKKSLVIDIGSNDGTLLHAFKNKGMHVLGIDPAVEISRAATEKGIKTIPAFFTPALASRIVKKYGLAAVVTANNLYANIDYLDEFTAGVKELLSPDGVFVFESFYLLDLMQNMVFDFIYHEHLSYFTVKPLQNYFKKHRMELIDVARIPTKGGSLRYTVQLAGGPRKVSSLVGKLLILESKFGVHKERAFKSFEKRINRAKKELTRLMKSLKSQGKTIAGYGASATTTTMIYHFDLADKLSFLIDDYARKQNTFSPGCHIPVLAPTEISKRKPDFILIIAWRYFQPIVAKNKSFLDAGGKFIVPLPKLKIISMPPIKRAGR